MNFLFFVYLIGVIIAVYQDVKRREIDNFLNLFLFFSGFAYFIFSTVGKTDSISMILAFCFFIVICAVLSFGLYSARAFAGGDAKLLFALSPLFFQLSFLYSTFNLGLFIVLLFLSGAVYGLVFSSFFLIRDFDRIKKFLDIEFRKKVYLITFCLIIIFFILGFFFRAAFLFCILGIVFMILFALARAVDAVSMMKKIKSINLREGDWLMQDIHVNGKIIKKTWEGLSEKEINFIKKHKKEVIIKDGLPYAFAFFIALVAYYFKDIILLWVFRFF